MWLRHQECGGYLEHRDLNGQLAKTQGALLAQCNGTDILLAQKNYCGTRSESNQWELVARDRTPTITIVIEK